VRIKRTFFVSRPFGKACLDLLGFSPLSQFDIYVIDSSDEKRGAIVSLAFSDIAKIIFPDKAFLLHPLTFSTIIRSIPLSK